MLAGLLIIIFTHGIIRFFEWSTLNLQDLDPFSDFLATLVPVVWVFFLYTFLQQISNQRKEHLNSILRSIKGINQLLIKVDDRGRLVRGYAKI